MRMKMRLITNGMWIALVLLTLGANFACAASFDCDKAGTKVEKMICADPELTKLDETVARGYALSQQDKKNASSTEKSQKQWLKERNRCADAACLKRQYQQRIDEMDEIIQHGNFLAAGGRYRMIDANFMYPNGEPYVERYAEICTDFLKNLDELPPDPPMACDVRFAPGMDDFKVPVWSNMDVWENRDFALQKYKYPSKSAAETKKRLANLRTYIDAGVISYKSSVFDIDNDGIEEHVLAGMYKSCNPDKLYLNPVWRGYNVYDPISRKIDKTKREFYERMGYWSNTSFFSYKDVTYLAKLYLPAILLEPDFPEKNNPNKRFIELFRPNPMGEHGRPVANGCKYVYLPPIKRSK